MAPPGLAAAHMPRPIARDPSGISNLGAFVLLLIALAFLTTSWYVFFVPGAGPEVLRADDGDRLSVDYIGYFQDTNLVFDTSLESVATDNASWPKAVSFTWRARWQPLPVTVGPESGVVEGFNDGLLGLARGASKTLVIPADLGYGASDPSKISARPILESVAVRLTMNATEFQTRYNALASSGANVTDPFWGWDAIVEVAGSVVTVTNSPDLHEIVRPHDAWDAQIVGIDDAANGGEGVILVRHLIEEEDSNRLGGTSGGEPFYVSKVDLDAGTYNMDFNREVVGRTLIFQVTIVILVRI